MEGSHYFPPDSIHRAHFRSGDRHTTCPWKGAADYYHITVAGQTNADAAWYYLDPKQAAAPIKNYVAFWRGVKVAE